MVVGVSYGAWPLRVCACPRRVTQLSVTYRIVTLIIAWNAISLVVDVPLHLLLWIYLNSSTNVVARRILGRTRQGESVSSFHHHLDNILQHKFLIVIITVNCIITESSFLL
jgi:hypothetical protein